MVQAHLTYGLQSLVNCSSDLLVSKYMHEKLMDRPLGVTGYKTILSTSSNRFGYSLLFWFSRNERTYCKCWIHHT